MGHLKGEQIGFYIWDTSSYKLVAAMTDRSFSRDSDEIDTTSTSSGGYASSLQGTKNASISLSGIAEFAPAVTELGRTKLKGLQDSGEEFDFKVAQIGGTDFPAEYGRAWLKSYNESYATNAAVLWDGTAIVNGGTTETDPHGTPTP